MRSILLGQDDFVGQWVSRELGHLWTPGAGTAIGWVENGRLLAGVTYTNFDGPNVWLGCAALPKSRWLDRRAIWYIFSYPFEQLKCRRISATIAESNAKSRKMVEGLGLHQEARLKRAAKDGGDVLIYTLFHEDCRWLARKAIK